MGKHVATNPTEPLVVRTWFEESTTVWHAEIAITPHTVVDSGNGWTWTARRAAERAIVAAIGQKDAVADLTTIDVDLVLLRTNTVRTDLSFTTVYHFRESL